MGLNALFGVMQSPPKTDPDDEVAVLREKLREAEAEIEQLRDALGGNHPLGRRSGGLF